MEDGDDEEGRGGPTSCPWPDIMYVPTWAGWPSPAVVLDVWSRRVLRWALAMAIARRRPEECVVHHSDRGSPYTSLAFGEHCPASGIAQSMGSVGDAYDNPLCESFFATLECELIWRRSFRTAAKPQREVFGFIEDFYKTRRLHSALGYESLANYERDHAAWRRTGGAHARPLSNA